MKYTDSDKGLGFRVRNVDYIPNADFEIVILDRVPIIQADPASGDWNDEGDEANWSSRISFSQVKARIGVVPLSPICYEWLRRACE